MEKNYANVREGRGDNSNEYAIVENRMVPYIVRTIISYFYWICRPPPLSLSHAFSLVINNKPEKWGTIVLAVKIVKGNKICQRRKAYHCQEKCQSRSRTRGSSVIFKHFNRTHTCFFYISLNNCMNKSNGASFKAKFR